MSIVLLRSFVALAQERSFVRAAARLHLSQPALTQQIRKLEDDFSAQLVVRHARHISLTAAGVALLHEAQGVIAQYQSLEGTVREAAAGASEVIHLGVVASAVYGTLPRLVRTFEEQRPGVRLHVQERTNEEMWAMLRAEQLDAAIFRGHPPVDIEAVELARDDYFACVPEDHPLARQGSARWVDLADDPLLMPERIIAAVDFDAIVAACNASGFHPDVRIDQFVGYSRLAMVAAGRGIAVVNGRATAMRVEGTVYRPLRPAVAAPRIHLAIRPDRRSEVTEHLERIAIGLVAPTAD